MAVCQIANFVIQCVCKRKANGGIDPPLCQAGMAIFRCLNVVSANFLAAVESVNNIPAYVTPLLLFPDPHWPVFYVRRGAITWLTEAGQSFSLILPARVKNRLFFRHTDKSVHVGNFGRSHKTYFCSF